MLNKLFTGGIISLFILSVVVPTIASDDYKIQKENLILNLSDCKELIETSYAHIVCIGRIDNLSIDETDYAFDCINVRMLFRANIEGTNVYSYLHFKNKNTMNSWIGGKSWGFSYTHSYRRDSYRFSIGNCNFNGIFTPSYIIGIFSFPISNTSSFYENIQFSNDRIKCEHESKIQRDTFVNIDFFVGAISDLVVNEEYYYFNATNILHISYHRWPDIEWRFMVQRIRDIKYSFYIGGIQFRGILTPNFICGFFFSRHSFP